MTQAPAPPFLRALTAADAEWVIARHAAHYAQEEGFDSSFEALVAQVVSQFLKADAPASHDRAWIAEAADGQRAGSIFCVRHDEDTAKVRLFYIEPAWRGTGLGRRMLSRCLEHAGQAGFARMTIWTHASHRAAGRLYARAGFRKIAARPVRNFGRDLVEETWTTPLGPSQAGLASEGRQD